MRQNAAVLLFAALALPMAALADDAINRAKLSGAWQIADKAGSTWTLAQSPDAVHITYSMEDHKLVDFECATSGRECAVKDSGKPAKVSMWFNGPTLVELETKGKEIVKRRFAVAEQGDTLELEVIPIVPEGKPETLRLQRVQR